MDENDPIWVAVETCDRKALSQAVAEGFNLNEALEDGETILFHAVLGGNIRSVQLLLELGADVNYEASEPAASMLAPRPLDLALQARFLMDWDKFNPIVKLLQESGGTEYDKDE